MVLDLWRDDRSNPRSLWRAWDDLHRDFKNAVEPFACDVEETQREFLLSFDLPGFKKEDISIERDGRMVTVSAKRERVSSDARLHRSERSYGSYHRSFTLPDNVKIDAIQASYNDGVLTVTLPKSELAVPTRIRISEGAGDNRQVDIKKSQPNQLQN